MQPAGDILVCFAVEEEARPFRQRCPPGVRIRVTGMGPANAARSVETELARGGVRLVLTCGFAGGLNPAWPRGTVLYEAGEDFPWADRLAQVGAVRGRFHLVERVVVTVQEKAQCRRTTGADAVEMESRVIRSLSEAGGIPSATVRVISDAADEALPLDFNAVMTPQMRVSPLKLGWLLLREPAQVGRLWQFSRALREPAAQLADLLVRVVVEPKRGG